MRGLLWTLCATLSAQVSSDANTAGKQVALGAELAKDVHHRFSVIDNPTIQDHLDQAGIRLAEQTPDVGFLYHFAVIGGNSSADLHEPIALPGGYVFLPKELFLKAGDEDEFAAILAHAMAHISARHHLRAAARAPSTQGSSIPLVFSGAWTGSPALMPAAIARTWRGFEFEADALALRMLAGAGFNPAGLQEYVARLRPFDDPSSPLPPVSERMKAMERILSTQPLVPYSPRQGFLRVRELLRNQ